MPEPMHEYLESDVECEGLLECLYGLGDHDLQRTLDDRYAAMGQLVAEFEAKYGVQTQRSVGH